MSLLRLGTLYSLLASFPVVLAAGDLSVAEPPRVKTFVASGDRLLEDLEFLIVDLAKENKQWADNIFPSIDIFLVGVDTRQPIRFDVLLGGNNAQGWRYQPSIPVANLKTFIDENLNPIGIDAKRKDRKGTYYELSGGVYDGGMRIVEEAKSTYACIAAEGFEKDDIPIDMPHPGKSHEDLVARGFDIAAEIINDPQTQGERGQQFLTFQKNMLAQVKKRPDETKESFALREASMRQQYEVLHRAYVEGKQAIIGWTTDTAKQEGRGDLLLSAIENTPLAEYLGTLAAEPSQFAALEVPEDPVLSVRINLAMDEFRKKHEREWYGLVRPVLQARLEAIESRNENEKAALQQIATQVIDMLVAGIEPGRLDLAADITASSSGHHTLLVAVAAKDGKAADAIVELIPQAHEGWLVEKDVDRAGDVTIHKIDVSKDTHQSLLKFFGPSGAIYVGSSAGQVWIAAGEQSLETMKSAIDTVVKQQTAPLTDNSVIALKLHLLPLLTLADSYIVETGFDLLDSLNMKAQMAGEPSEEKTDKDGPIGSGGLKPIDPAELRALAIKALQDIDDRVSVNLKRMDDRLEGQTVVAPGALRTIGKIIAKVASENL